MPDPISLPARSAAWKWWVCSLLLLATMINYMDRITLNQVSVRVMKEVGFQEDRYGDLESAFAYAFAIGAVLVGWLADRINVRWLYPAALLAWSAAGFATGLVQGFAGLVVCRFLLGLAEAGHWPCALRTTQHILPPVERSMGNSILQSGAAIGAVLTPLLILGLPTGPGTWRYPFLIIGAAGATWALVWLVSVRSADLAHKRLADPSSPWGLLLALGGLFALKSLVRWGPYLPEGLAFQPPAGLALLVSFGVSGLGVTLVLGWLLRSTRGDEHMDRGDFVRRLAVLVFVVVMINGCWHFFRAWLPLFLQNEHGYDERFMQWFIIAYYLSTDVGTLSSGWAALRLARGGLPLHASRLTMFAVCAGLCAMAGVSAALLPRGPVLLAALLVVGFGALGLFPHYYSLSQELTTRHQGKLTGALGCSCWLAMAPVHETVGDVVKQTGSYSLGMTVAGLAPLLGLGVLLLFWGQRKPAPAQGPVLELSPSA